MRKTRKRSLSAAVIAFALSFGLAFSPLALNVKTAGAATQGFTNSAVAVSATNEALSGWQYYFYDASKQKSDNGFYYESDKMFLKAVADGHTGNGMLMERLSATDEFHSYSYKFNVKSNQLYKISGWFKSECSDNAQNKLIFGLQDNYVDRYTLAGATGGWEEHSFYYTTGAAETQIAIKITAEGVGKFYIDDITVKESTAHENSVSYRMQGIGKVSDGASDELGDAEKGKANMNVLKAANISSDSSDGDNASLILNDGEIFKTNFAAFVNEKTYRLSFKYKMIESGSENRLWCRINYKTLEDKLSYSLDVSGGSATEWQTYSYDFKAPGDTSGQGIAIRSFAKYLIDELKIVCLDEADPIQLVSNGSFSGAYLGGYYLGENSNIAKQEDGTAIFIAGNGSYDSTFGARGYVEYTPSGLTAGEEYTISYDYRFNGADWVNSVVAYHGGTVIKEVNGVTAGWVNSTHTFVATGSDTFKLYGPSYYYWTTYYRNIQITDGTGKTYNANTSLVGAKEVLGENVFVYGEFNGNIQNQWSGWTFENGGIYGLKFQDNNTDWKLNLFGTAEAAATAISDEITVTANAIVVEQKFYQGEAKVTLIVGEKEIEATDDGVFVLPEGTTAVKVKYSASEYVAIKKIFIGSHVHGDDCANIPVSNSEAVYEWSEDNKTCTATMLYICGAKSTITETATAVITDNTATLYEKGTGLYTVTFEDSRFATQSKTAETEVRSPENVALNVGETENGSVKLTVGDTAITEFPYTIMEKTEVTVTATAERGYKLVAITVNGVAIEGNTFTVDGATVVSATFEKDPLFRSITAATAENGTVTVDVANAYDGETVTVTATAAEGYELDYITVNGETIEGNTFTVAGDATVSAVFKKLPEREVMEGCSSSAGFNGGFALILVAVALAFVLKAKRA